MLSRRLALYLYGAIGALLVGAVVVGVIMLAPDQQAAARFDEAPACSGDGAGCLVDQPGTLLGHHRREVQRSKPVYTALVVETSRLRRQSVEHLHFTYPAFDRLKDGEPVTLRFYNGQVTDIFANGDHFRTDHNPDVNFAGDYGLIYTALAVGAVMVVIIVALLVLTRRIRREPGFGRIGSSEV